MQQIETYLGGERNYLKINGDTGPLVYPAGHVHLYRLLYSLTSSGRDIPTAQLIFAACYLATLAVVMACYRRAGGVPPWVYPMLVLSKRLHSVYVLRLFNDCWAVLGLWLAVLALQRGWWRTGAAVFSMGLAVKMSLLLVLPAVGAVVFVAAGTRTAVEAGLVVLQWQVLLGWPFLVRYPREYVARAFEFSRVFEWKWTVNWRFVGKDAFLSRKFATALLVGHISLLALFALTRWLRPLRMDLTDMVRSLFRPLSDQQQQNIRARVTPDFVLVTLLSANVVGMLCARSLHYQFYSWLAWGTPYLAWRSGLPPVVVYMIWAAQEYAWNVYPSTPVSSAVAVAALAIQVGAVWVGTETAFDSGTAPAKRVPGHKPSRKSQ